MTNELWIVAILVWLALGAWGSSIGRNYMIRHFGIETELPWYRMFYIFMAIGGPVNLIVTAMMFWRR